MPAAQLRTPGIMLQGTGSDAGKSVLAAGLLRALKNRGMRPAPFKPQNMSNNAAVTIDGGEIGRAQSFQAFAAGRDPHSLMNPVLLKPEGEGRSQLVVRGLAEGAVSAQEYYRHKDRLLNIVLESFTALSQQADIIVIEGAGSPAEINLRAADIANMGFACAVGAPVLLVADIDRGGVFASLAGTQQLLSSEERALLKGYIINKFRGDKNLLTPAFEMLKPHFPPECLGIVPFSEHPKYFADEDSMSLAGRYSRRQHLTQAQISIVAVRLPHIANFDDFQPLIHDARIDFAFADLDEALPVCDWVILPGSKNTIADLQSLKQSGWSGDLTAHLRRGGKILGLCGGYQMLGWVIHNPHHIESDIDSIDGLRLLELETVLESEKTLHETRAFYPHHGQNIPLCGYEIHLGNTAGDDLQNGWLQDADGRMMGATPTPNRPWHGQIFGCYLHGIFAASSFYEAFFALSSRSGIVNDNFVRKSDAALDQFAHLLEQCLDIDRIIDIAAQK